MLPDGYNTQAGEQNFQEIVKYVGGLREMSRGRNRFMTMSLYQVWSFQFSKTPVSQRDTLRRNRERGEAPGEKHARREAQRKAMLKPGAKTPKGPRMVRGRFAVPKTFIETYPLGLPEALTKKTICGALHHTQIRIAVFRDNEDRLGKLVKSILPIRNQTSERKFAAVAALKEFLVDKLEEENPYVDFLKPGAFTVQHECSRCK